MVANTKIIRDRQFGFHRFLNVIAVVVPFNQEKALVEAFTMIVKTLWTFVSSFSPDTPKIECNGGEPLG